MQHLLSIPSHLVKFADKSVDLGKRSFNKVSNEINTTNKVATVAAIAFFSAVAIAMITVAALSVANPDLIFEAGQFMPGEWSNASIYMLTTGIGLLAAPVTIAIFAFPKEPILMSRGDDSGAGGGALMEDDMMED